MQINSMNSIGVNGQTNLLASHKFTEFFALLCELKIITQLKLSIVANYTLCDNQPYRNWKEFIEMNSCTNLLNY